MRHFVTGGCVYRMQRDERGAASIAELAVHASNNPSHKWAGHDAMHTSNLPQGRALWLRRLIECRSIGLAISIDGDTTFEASQLLKELSLVTGDVAIGLCPVRIGGTEDLCNLCLTVDEERISESLEPAKERRIGWNDELRSVLRGNREIASGGFGVAVFNLEWYRRYWPDPAPEAVSIHTGEDIEHCRSVRRRNGKIIALKVSTDHFAWGERQTR